LGRARLGEVLERRKEEGRGEEEKRFYLLFGAYY